MWEALKRFGSNTSPRTQRLLGTVAASYMARFTAALMMLITVPLARSQLPSEAFGLWMMLSSLLGFFAFADLGIANGVLNRLSAALHADRSEEVGRLMLAGYFCTTASGLVLIAAWAAWLLGAAQPLAFAGVISPERQQEAAWAFSTFVVLMAINLPAQLAQKFQLAYQDGHWVGLCQLGSTLITLACLPIALMMAAPLSVLLLCSLGSQVLVTLLSAAFWLRRRGLLTLLGHSVLESKTVFSLLRTGSMFFVLQLCGAFAFQSDSFVIVQIEGQAAYGDFAAFQRLYLSLGSLVSAALLGLWPAFAEALARGDLRWARSIYFRSLIVGLVAMGGLSALVSLGMPWISRHWLGMHAAPPLGLVVALGSWAVIEMLGQITGTLLNGAGILKAQVLIAALMAGSAFAAKWWLVGQLGPYGAVVATIVFYTLVAVPAQAWLIAGVFWRKPAARVSPADSPSLPTTGTR